MCGIVGLIDSGPDVVRRVVPIMRDVMISRGPDGAGEFFEGSIGMAMRRLSVIDLERGWQPLTSRDGQVVAFQNGEIYNHTALRRELESDGFVFKTHSDTEVLAHGFACWGIDGLLERIDGMFALAILDRSTRQLHLARDRFGEKPLFYCHAPGKFAYGSNLVALAALPWVDRTLDLISLDRYLALHFVPGDRTILSGIRRVLPGERLVVPIDDPNPARHRYYRIPVGPEHRVQDEELAAQVGQSVASRLVADVPVGVFLSGGLDSSIVASIAARHAPRIDTFSIGFESRAHDESPHAEQVARAIGSTHHHFRFDQHSFGALLPRVAAALDEPVGDQAMLPLFWLCQEARQYVTVVLSGEGADEVFGGYDYYRGAASSGGWRRRLLNVFNAARRERGGGGWWGDESGSTPSGFPLLTDASERTALLGRAMGDKSEWEQDLASWLDRSASTLQRASAFDMATWLPDDLLVKYDRMAMAHSLEGRAPYLNPALVEMGLRLPSSERMASGWSKVQLRRALADRLPSDIAQRPKQGFVLPMGAWLQEWFEGYGGVEAYFSKRPVPGLDNGRLSRLVSGGMDRGVHRQRFVFAMVMLAEWYSAYDERVGALGEAYRKAQ
jgi:asparagine synthase (glutamine-hydrolysing)